jgi:hypothetical protein
VLIIAPLQQRLVIEVFISPVVGKERDASLVMHPVVVVDVVIG